MSSVLPQGLADLGHQMQAAADSYQDFGSGLFVWSLGEPAATAKRWDIESRKWVLNPQRPMR
uniref:Uncharacterized protein n=1 Tax=mine drainage metagenome TaxID=410659 RepID=E6PVD6_9ZZZZ